MKRLVLFLMFFTALAVGVEAREVYNLNNDWRFFFKEENTSDDARFVRLPHTWNHDALSGDGTYRQTMGNYRRTLFVPQDWSGRRLFLRFHGVQSVADVFLNGRHIGEHRGGRTAFTLEITEGVKFGGENVLLVVVNNSFQNDVLPTSTEENLYGGIYRDVELIVTDPVTIAPTYYGTDGVLVRQREVTSEKVEGSVGVMLSGRKEASCTVEVNILSPDGYVAHSKNIKAKADGKMLEIPFTLSNPELWSPLRPNLYTVSVSVGGDNVSVTTGFRRIEVTAQNKFTINGKRYHIHGVTLMHDDAVNGSAMRAKDIARDFAAVRDMGANAIRSAAGPHAQYLYDLCDRNGVVVWVETPLTQAPFLADVAYFGTQRFEENGREQLCEVIMQNYNHPSVVMWGIFSLLRGKNPLQLNYVREQNALAKRLDSSRPTVACSNQDGDINFITDLIVWQQNMGWESGSPEDLVEWQKALSQNWNHLAQAVCYGEGGTYGNQNESFVHRTGGSQHRIPESWQTRYHEAYTRYIDTELFWGVWLNTMFDFGSARYTVGFRNSGLMGFDHFQHKDAAYIYRALWNTSSPTLHLTGKNYEVRMNPRQVLTVYSSKGEPTLYLNDEPVAVERYSEGIFRTDTLSLSGSNRVRVEAGELSDEMELTIGNYLRRRE